MLESWKTAPLKAAGSAGARVVMERDPLTGPTSGLLVIAVAGSVSRCVWLPVQPHRAPQALLDRAA
jgi:hypothetical protein